MSQKLSTNTFAVAKWVVSADATQGTHTTIQSAINSASSGDTIFVRDGTYTENLTLIAGITITALLGDSIERNVKVIGKVTMTVAGTTVLAGLTLQTNSDFCVAVTGANAVVLVLNQCVLLLTNNTAISYTNSNASSGVELLYCQSNVSIGGITLFSNSSAGSLSIIGGVLLNSVATTASTCSGSGGTTIYSCEIFGFPISTSGTSNLQIYNSLIATNNPAAICITHASTGTSNLIQNSSLFSDTSAAISISGGSTMEVVSCTIDCNTANGITGAGTLTYTGINFSRAASPTVINTTTLTPSRSAFGAISFDGMVNNLSKFTDWTSFTPTIFGASTAGTTTYSLQNGQWMRIGNLAVVQFTISVTAATGTGNLTVGNLPFTISNTISINPQCAAGVYGLTWPGGTTQIVATGSSGTTNCIMNGVGSGSAGATLQMANASFTIAATLTYRI